MSLFTLGLTERFDFHLSNVPNSGAVVTVRLYNGATSAVKVTRGSQHEIKIPPVGTPPNKAYPVLVYPVGSRIPLSSCSSNANEKNLFVGTKIIGAFSVSAAQLRGKPYTASTTYATRLPPHT